MMVNHWYSDEKRDTVCEQGAGYGLSMSTADLERLSCPACTEGMQSKLSEAHIEEAERLLGYYEQHGAVHNWGGDAAALLRHMLPEWSAFKAAEVTA